MRAIVIEKFGGPEVLTVKDVEIPSIEKNEVLIKTKAVSVNFADIKTRTGNFHAAGKPPIIPGLDAAGIVEKVGEDVKDIKEGDRVIAFPKNGSYAEYIVADSVLVFKIPDSMDFNTAAASPLVAFTSYQLIKTVGRLEKGETILIHAAAGGIGTTAIQIAKHLGAGTIIGTVGSDEKMKIAKDAGADIVINYNKDDFKTVIEEKLGEQPVDVILDSVAGDVFQKSLECLAPYGRLVNFNSSSGKAGTLDTKELHSSCRAVLGFSMGTTIKKRPEMLKDIAKEVLPLLADNKVTMLINNTYSFEEASDAHRLLESRKSIGKNLLIP